MKKTLVNITALIFTILNFIKLELQAPVNDEAYRAYANLYGMLTSICFIIISICYSTGIVTRFIKSLLIINIGMYLVVGVKISCDIADTNNYFDWTYAGLFVIAAIWYFLNEPNQTE